MLTAFIVILCVITYVVIGFIAAAYADAKIDDEIHTVVGVLWPLALPLSFIAITVSNLWTKATPTYDMLVEFFRREKTKLPKAKVVK